MNGFEIDFWNVDTALVTVFREHSTESRCGILKYGVIFGQSSALWTYGTVGSKQVTLPFDERTPYSVKLCGSGLVHSMQAFSPRPA